MRRARPSKLRKLVGASLDAASAAVRGYVMALFGYPVAQEIDAERAPMVDAIRAYARLEVDVLGPQGISERVLEAMGQTELIHERACSVAYVDAPVLIGHGQTISQPFIVALMTISLRSNQTIQSWKLVPVQVTRPQCWRVWFERFGPLRLSHHWTEAAAKVLRELGYDNVSIKVGDGYLG